MHRRLHLVLLLLPLVAAVTSAEARVPARVCKETCTSLVAQDCAGLLKKKLRRCRAKILRKCKRGSVPCVVTTTTLPVGPGCPTTFLVSEQYPGGTLHTVAIGDLNGDAKRDLVVGANPAVMVRLGNGDGTFGSLGAFEAGGDVRGVAIADVDGDTKPDLVAANFDSDPPPTGPSTVVNVSVLMNLGNGTFDLPVPYFVGTRDFHDVVAADFDGDQKLDLAVATQPSVVVLLNNGNGTFADRVEYPSASTSRAVAVGDFNADGKLDLAATGGGPPGGRGVVAILLGDGNGAFAGPVAYEVGRFPYSIVAGDVNGDGKVDLATANNNSSDMSILLGNGNGTFGASVEHDAGGLPTSLAGGDFNADGRLDFVISAGPNATVGLFTGIGDGAFANVDGTFTAGSAALASGDLDGDGKTDVLSATPLGHRVLLSRCP